MGLNAVVYRNREHLPFDPNQLGGVFDERTGECYVQNRSSKDFDEQFVVAVSRRLGNVSAIEDLADAVECSLGPDSLLRSRVLFNGTHAGDVIDVGSLEQLRGEIEQVRRTAHGRTQALLSEFMRSMEELVQAALNEGNPIVFT